MTIRSIVKPAAARGASSTAHRPSKLPLPGMPRPPCLKTTQTGPSHGRSRASTPRLQTRPSASQSAPAPEGTLAMLTRMSPRRPHARAAKGAQAGLITTYETPAHTKDHAHSSEPESPDRAVLPEPTERQTHGPPPNEHGTRQGKPDHLLVDTSCVITVQPQQANRAIRIRTARSTSQLISPRTPCAPAGPGSPECG